jgi:PIN domain nuclease of toxin-antitoxin system
MQWEHRDPFDRLLVAQALTEGVPLLTIDPVVTHVPGLRTEDPRRSA